MTTSDFIDVLIIANMTHGALPDMPDDLPDRIAAFADEFEGKRVLVNDASHAGSYQVLAPVSDIVRLTDAVIVRHDPENAGLASYLKPRDGMPSIRAAYVCGFPTDRDVLLHAVCARSTPRIQTVAVLSNLCAGTSPQAHATALSAMAELGITII